MINITNIERNKEVSNMLMKMGNSLILESSESRNKNMSIIGKALMVVGDTIVSDNDTKTLGDITLMLLSKKLIHQNQIGQELTIDDLKSFLDGYNKLRNDLENGID